LKKTWLNQTETSYVNFLFKKRKVSSEHIVFQDKWTDEYCCLPMNGKVLCVICNEGINVLKTLAAITIGSTQEITEAMSVL
jgi:hypothetical protein